eukprot:4846456-Prymnesium_polylepis.1
MHILCSCTSFAHAPRPAGRTARLGSFAPLAANRNHSSIAAHRCRPSVSSKVNQSADARSTSSTVVLPFVRERDRAVDQLAAVYAGTQLTKICI